jgi:hypothetical protein
MSIEGKYIVEVVGPSGCERFLTPQGEGTASEAIRYPTPSDAWEAANKYQEFARQQWPNPPAVFVIDRTDGERGIVPEDAES